MLRVTHFLYVAATTAEVASGFTEMWSLHLQRPEHSAGTHQGSQISLRFPEKDK